MLDLSVFGKLQVTYIVQIAIQHALKDLYW